MGHSRSSVLFGLLLSINVYSTAAPLESTPQTHDPLTYDPLTDKTMVTRGTPGVFDLYFFTQQWEQTFCSENPDKQGCGTPAVNHRTTLGLHGLWPQYSNSKNYPQYCQGGPGCPKGDNCPLDWNGLSEDIRSFLTTAIPTDAESLAKHEWQKHGTCSGLTQQEYFQTIRTLFNRMPTHATITDNIGGSTSYSAIQDDYEHQVLLQCSKNDSYLLSVVSCWDATTKKPAFMRPISRHHRYG